MTVYASLRKSRSSDPRKAELVAFGDPIVPARSPVVRTARRDDRFEPLPFSRLEVESIVRVHQGPSRKFLGAEATEEHAKDIGPSAKYIHFATHAILDERFPLSSALVLSSAAQRDGQDNGLLEAWEIIEGVRWQADLVVLSACETALGKEVVGEGLMGLTRAIQYAGARSVLSSLWSIDDRRTAQLMGQFYHHLEEGESKDSALRSAQLDMLRQPYASRPLYWAAFTLNGDWQ